MDGRAFDGRRVCLGIIVVLGAALRLWGVDFGLPHTQCRPDESTLVNKALSIGAGDPNPHFFNYPSFHLYVLAGLFGLYAGGGVLVGHFESLADFGRAFFFDPSTLFLLGRLLSVAMGSASIWLVYHIGRYCGGGRVGLLAAFFLSTAFLHVRDAHFATVDVPATCYALGALGLLVRAVETQRPSAQVWAAALLGLGVSTKYNVAFFALAFLPVIYQAPRPWRRLAVLSGVGLAAFLVGTPFALLDFGAFWRDLSFERQHFAIGHGIDLGMGWIRHLTFTLPQGLGWPLLLAGLGGAVWAAWRGSPQVTVLLLAGGAYYLGAGAGRTVFMRYMVPLVPVFCLLAAWGLGRLGRRWHWGWLMLVAALLALPSLSKSLYHDALLGRADTRLLAAEWIQSQIPSGTRLAMTGSPYGYPPLHRSRQWLTQRLEDVRQAGLPGRRLEYMLGLAGYPPEPHYDILELRPAAAGESWRSVRPTFEVDRLAREGIQWVVLQQHPLGYSRPDSAFVAALVARAERVAHFVGVKQGAVAVYDPIDAYYVPVAGFAGVLRPGPNISIYRLKRAPN